VKLAVTLMVAASMASFAPAQTSTAAPATSTAANPNVRHVIGLDNIKQNATGQLTVENNALQFKTDKAVEEVPLGSIDDIFIGTESTQSGGKTGKVVKGVAMAAPYGSGRALSIMMRTKVDILTVSYHNPDGAMHGAIFALPIGQAEAMRAQLIQAGAHASPLEEKITEGSKP
jgi:hypothetical protein